MSKINYTKDHQGLQKMRGLIDVPNVVMMATRLDKVPFSICPMTLQEIDEQGDLWFITAKDSGHFKDIEYDNRVQLIYTDEQKQKYISIFGNATHIIDQEKVNQLWSPMLNAWFEGKDDPQLVLLNINIENAYYWERDGSKMVSFFEMTKSALGDSDPEVGNKGYINLQNH